MKKKFSIAIVLIFIMMLIFTHASMAEFVKVTKESLEEELKKYAELSKENEEGQRFEYEISDNKLFMKSGGESYSIDYDLTGDPKFYVSVPIKQGMSYDEYEKQTAALQMPMIAYILTAGIQGIELEDAISYIGMSMLGSAFSSLSNEGVPTTSYIIQEDDDTTITSSTSNVIKKSEFGNHVMEYINSIYKETQTIDDSLQEINSFKWTTEKKDVTDNSCTLVSTLVVNRNADFSKIKEYLKKLQEQMSSTFENTTDTTNSTLTTGSEETDIDTSIGSTTSNGNIATNNQSTNTDTASNTTNEKQNNKIPSTKLPKTGKEENVLLIVLYSVLTFCVISLIFVIKYKVKLKE